VNTPRPYPVPPAFGARIRAERESRGWSLAQMGIPCGVSAQTVLRAERGNDVSLAIAIAFARVLGLGLEDMLGGADGEHAATEGSTT
jgi:transcriptional regulator with XRE-family HTH domain